MAKHSISVCWKDHPSELATICKSLLDNNYLVDCTISAEGQCLRAHRLILSASSPYFHMLFNEEREKYPLVVLLDASFEILKSVIDFVYCGKVLIPQENLKAFLALVQALQIKGLSTSTEKDVNKDICGSSAGNIFPCPSDDNDGIREDQGPNPISEDSPGDLSELHQHCLDAHADAQTSSSLHFDGCSDSWENGESESIVPPLRGQPALPCCDELTIKKEIHVNSDESWEPNEDLLDHINSDEPKPGNLLSEMEERETVPAFGEQNLNQYSGIREVSYGDVEAATVQPTPHRLQEQQQNSQLLDEKPPGPVAEQPQPLLPVILVPKSERPVSDAEWEESVNQNSSAVGRSPLLDQPTMRRGRLLQRRPHECSYCHKTFVTPWKLQRHLLIHTGERPYACHVCGKAFSQSGALTVHKRLHTGERPFSCDVCEKTFNESYNLFTHMRLHTGVRPYFCDVCGKSFNTSSILRTHMRVHTGERPFSCDVCGKAFSNSSALTVHKRIHTGERPYVCDFCSKSFTTKGFLVRHLRVHQLSQCD